MLAQADVTVGDVIVFGTVHFLVSKQVVSLEKLPAVAAFYAALSAQAPVQAAIEAANALVRSMSSSVVSVLVWLVHPAVASSFWLHRTLALLCPQWSPAQACLPG